MRNQILKVLTFYCVHMCVCVGDVDAAQGTLQHCLDVDSAYSDAHILMAQIYLHQNNFKLANQSLEVGLSYNIEVRVAMVTLALL